MNIEELAGLSGAEVLAIVARELAADAIAKREAQLERLRVLRQAGLCIGRQPQYAHLRGTPAAGTYREQAAALKVSCTTVERYVRAVQSPRPRIWVPAVVPTLPVKDLARLYSVSVPALYRILREPAERRRLRATVTTVSAAERQEAATAAHIARLRRRRPKTPLGFKRWGSHADFEVWKPEPPSKNT